MALSEDRGVTRPGVIAAALLLVMLAIVAYVDMRYKDPLPVPGPVPTSPTPATAPDPLGRGT